MGTEGKAYKKSLQFLIEKSKKELENSCCEDCKEKNTKYLNAYETQILKFANDKNFNSLKIPILPPVKAGYYYNAEGYLSPCKCLLRKRQTLRAEMLLKENGLDTKYAYRKWQNYPLWYKGEASIQEVDRLMSFPDLPKEMLFGVKALYISGAENSYKNDVCKTLFAKFMRNGYKGFYVNYDILLLDFLTSYFNNDKFLEIEEYYNAPILFISNFLNRLTNILLHVPRHAVSLPNFFSWIRRRLEDSNKLTVFISTSDFATVADKAKKEKASLDKKEKEKPKLDEEYKISLTNKTAPYFAYEILAPYVEKLNFKILDIAEDNEEKEYQQQALFDALDALGKRKGEWQEKNEQEEEINKKEIKEDFSIY